MSKTKVQTMVEEDIDISSLPDDIAIMLGYKQASGDIDTKIRRMKINIDDVDSDGNEVPPKTFNVYGTNLYAKSILFRPLDSYNQVLRTVQKSGIWKTENETVLFKPGQQPIDIGGGVACGRILSQSLQAEMTESERDLNRKKASFYTHLFGLAYFNNEEPVLVDFRLTGSKGMVVSNVLRQIEKEIGKGKHTRYLLKFSLVSEKGSIHPNLAVEPHDLSKELPVNKDIVDAAKDILSFVQRKNAWVTQKYEAAQMQKGTRQSTKKLVDSIVSDVSVNDLPDDEIPF